MKAYRLYLRLTRLEEKAVAFSRPTKPILPEWLFADAVAQGMRLTSDGVFDWTAWKIICRANAQAGAI